MFVMVTGLGCVCHCYRPWVCLSWLQALGVFVMVTGLWGVCHEDRCVSWLQALGVFVIITGLGCVCHGYRPWVCLS